MDFLGKVCFGCIFLLIFSLGCLRVCPPFRIHQGFCHMFFFCEGSYDVFVVASCSGVNSISLKKGYETGCGKENVIHGACGRILENLGLNSKNTVFFVPQLIGSMGLVYLPTWIGDFFMEPVGNGVFLVWFTQQWRQIWAALARLWIDIGEFRECLANDLPTSFNYHLRQWPGGPSL